MICTSIRKRDIKFDDAGDICMTFQQIRYIEAVAQTGSVSKAAALLYVAQSSISASIKDVEDEYGIRIFERTSKGMGLTHVGREFLTDIQYISNYYSHVDSKYRQTLHRERQFSVSTLHHVCGDGPFLELLRRNSGRSYHFRYLEGNTTSVFENVASGRSDVGIVFFTEKAKGIFMQDIHKRGLVFNHLSYGNMYIYLHDSHPLASCPSVTHVQMIKYPRITYDDLNPEAGKYTTSFQQRDKNVQVLHVSDRAAAYSILRMGQAYATGSGYLSTDEHYHDIISIPVEDLEKLEMGFLVRENALLSDLAEEYISLLKMTTTSLSYPKFFSNDYRS